MRREMLIRLASAVALMLVVVAQGNAWPWLAETAPQPVPAAPTDGAPDDAAPPAPPACIAALADVAPPRCGEAPRLSHRARESLHDALGPAAAHTVRSWVAGFAAVFEFGVTSELRSPFDPPPHAAARFSTAQRCDCLSRSIRSVIRRTGPPRA